MITFSGVRIEPSSRFPQYNGTPTLVDIALGLGRMPRFAGQTRRWWTGIHHALVCCKLAHNDLKPSLEMFLCLLHDAHEIVTCDLPFAWKPQEMSDWQEELDERIFKFFGVWPVSPEQAAYVKKIDTRALRAEAMVIGPPTIMCHLGDAMPADLKVVQEIAEKYPEPYDTNGIDSAAAQEFYATVANLIGDSVVERNDDHRWKKAPKAALICDRCWLDAKGCKCGPTSFREP